MIGLNFLFVVMLSSYPWPLRPFNTAHSVSATLGDTRGSVAVPRFHRGIDIPAGNGSDVFSITSGIANYDGSSGANAHVRVGEYWYIHLKDDRFPEVYPIVWTEK